MVRLILSQNFMEDKTFWETSGRENLRYKMMCIIKGESVPTSPATDSPSHLHLWLTHGNDYVILGFSLHIRNDTSFYGFPVHGERLYALFHVIWVHNFDVVGALAELTG